MATIPTPKKKLAPRDVQGLRDIDVNTRQLLQALVSNQEYIFGKGGNPAIFKDQYDNDLADLINNGSTETSKTITSDYSILSVDHTIYKDTTSGDIITVLPSPINNKNKIFIVMKTSSDSNDAEVIVIGDKLINGFEGVFLDPKSSITLKSDGTQYHIVSSTKDIDNIPFEAFFNFSDGDNFLYTDGDQLTSLIKGN